MTDGISVFQNVLLPAAGTFQLIATSADGHLTCRFNPLAIADRIHITGDFNQDGTVDAADYVVWRKGLGTTTSQSEYNDWRAHFGETANGSGTGTSIAAVSAQPTFVAASDDGDGRANDPFTLEKQQVNDNIVDAPTPSSIEAVQPMPADDPIQPPRDLSAAEVATRTQPFWLRHDLLQQPFVNRHAHQVHVSLSPVLATVLDQGVLAWLQSKAYAHPKFDDEYHSWNWSNSAAKAISESEFDIALEDAFEQNWKVFTR